MPESLFTEHWRRFFLLPQQDDCITGAISEALFWDDQMGWSLGVIPWRAWRYPFQRAMLLYLSKHCPQKEQVYNLVNTALATAHGDYFSLPLDTDRDALLGTVHSFCSERTAEEISYQIYAIKQNPPFLGSRFLERALQHLSGRRRVRKNAEFVQYLSCFLHFRIINEFLKRCDALFPAEMDVGNKDVIAIATFAILRSVPLEAPHFYTGKRLKADMTKMSPEIYNFWSWQYTYRNEEYQRLRKPLNLYLRQSDIVFANAAISNHKEYQIAYKRVAGEYDLFGMMAPEYDSAVNNTIGKFGYYPAWPINGYTSDFILGRMLSGEFRYWERNTPPPKVAREKELHLCLRNAALCSCANWITQTATDGKRTFEVCAPECIVAVKEQEQNIYQEIVNEERSRIRPESIHRMIGLWLWDYCREHGVKPADAMRALKDRHFPKENPGWDTRTIPEIKNSAKNDDWYSYREKTTETPILYADYQDACRCIEAAKFLPRLRGVKKAVKSKPAKGKTKSSR
jgi:hypothetical protein